LSFCILTYVYVYMLNVRTRLQFIGFRKRSMALITFLILLTALENRLYFRFSPLLHHYVPVKYIYSRCVSPTARYSWAVFVMVYTAPRFPFKRRTPISFGVQLVRHVFVRNVYDRQSRVISLIRFWTAWKCRQIYSWKVLMFTRYSAGRSFLFSFYIFSAKSRLARKRKKKVAPLIVPSSFPPENILIFLHLFEIQKHNDERVVKLHGINRRGVV